MKSKRQQAILQIIRTRAVDTQEDLMNCLREAGFAVTQATVSRDIKELRLVKTLDAEGRYRYTDVRKEPEAISSRLHSLFGDAVRSVDHAGNIVVVKCLSGTAGAVCAAADSLQLPSIVGSLAGDDTFICVARSEQDAATLAEQFRALVED